MDRYKTKNGFQNYSYKLKYIQHFNSTDINLQNYMHATT